jgi:hypothetical protein
MQKENRLRWFIVIIVSVCIGITMGTLIGVGFVRMQRGSQRSERLPDLGPCSMKPEDFDAQIGDFGGSEIPEDLSKAVEMLRQTLSEECIDVIRSISEEEMKLMHLGLGSWIRSRWGLWSNTSASPLLKYFQGLGIYHPDDMSSIIIASLWRDVNNAPIDLDGQINNYKEYWKNIREEYQSGVGSEKRSYNVDLISGDLGHIYIRGINIPNIHDFMIPLIEESKARIEECWKNFPDTEGNSAVQTAIMVTVSIEGLVVNSDVIHSGLSGEHAICLAEAMIGAETTKHPEATYRIEVWSYKKGG